MGATTHEVSGSEKLEIRIVEQSHLPTKRTLDQLGIARRTFYRWYDRYIEGGPVALEAGPRHPAGCGTVCPARSTTGSSNWRYASPMSCGSSCRKPRSTGCSRPMI
ncbi:helix-turn-helix domain-containing protein [Rhodoligotrophos appendicifer]|uniref:helix-turn-helix domain-containing protein n=1 Tax=Rhodoligotrophos appendicifer TaxID=987056 RepID=UPI003D162F49